MKIKASELIGKPLDWAVAVAEEESIRIVKGQLETLWTDKGWKPSTDPSQSWPIIDREGIDLYCNVPTNPDHKDVSWRARYCRCGFGTDFSYGPTSLTAAMRAFVASKLGDEVEIPEELL